MMSNRSAEATPSGEFIFRGGEISSPARHVDGQLPEHICQQLVVAGNQYVAITQSNRQEIASEQGSWLVRKISQTRLYRWMASREGQIQEMHITTEVETRPMDGDRVVFAPLSSRSEKLTDQSEREEVRAHVHPFFQLRALEERLQRERNDRKSGSTSDAIVTEHRSSDPSE